MIKSLSIESNVSHNQFDGLVCKNIPSIDHYFGIRVGVPKPVLG